MRRCPVPRPMPLYLVASQLAFPSFHESNDGRRNRGRNGKIRVSRRPLHSKSNTIPVCARNQDKELLLWRDGLPRRYCRSCCSCGKRSFDRHYIVRVCILRSGTRRRKKVSPSRKKRQAPANSKSRKEKKEPAWRCHCQASAIRALRKRKSGCVDRKWLFVTFWQKPQNRTLALLAIRVREGGFNKVVGLVQADVLAEIASSWWRSLVAFFFQIWNPLALARRYCSILESLLTDGAIMRPTHTERTLAAVMKSYF